MGLEETRRLRARSRRRLGGQCARLLRRPLAEPCDWRAARRLPAGRWGDRLVLEPGTRPVPGPAERPGRRRAGRPADGGRLHHGGNPQDRRRHPAEETGRLHQQRHLPAGPVAGQHAELGIRRAGADPRPHPRHAQGLRPFAVAVHRGRRPGARRTTLQLRQQELGAAGFRVGVPGRHQVAGSLPGPTVRPEPARRAVLLPRRQPEQLAGRRRHPPRFAVPAPLRQRRPGAPEHRHQSGSRRRHRQGAGGERGDSRDPLAADRQRLL
ncbi:hypothetical protein D3C76_1022140 [compost metagenome]